MKIKQLIALLHDMDPEGTLVIFEPDPDDSGMGCVRQIRQVWRGWSTEAHDANGQADILNIDLEQ